jgi:uncharacterized protein (DUF3820 family)
MVENIFTKKKYYDKLYKRWNKMAENNTIVPFGKYKGQPIEVLRQDPGYCEWFLAQDNIKKKYPTFCQIIINNFCEPSDTPEHNALQTRFLDNDFCLALAKLCKWKLFKKINCIRNLEKAIRNVLKMSYNTNSEYDKRMEKIEELKSMKDYVNESIFEVDGKELLDGEPFFRIKKVFEQDGWDVIIQTDDTECQMGCVGYKECYINQAKIAIEIKPVIGDDFPAILRQMKIARIHPDFQCLIFDKFNAIGATIDQIKSMFESSGFLVFSFDDIEKAKNKY